MLADSIKTLALLSYLFVLNWRLTLVLLVVVPLIIFSVRYLRKKIRKAYFDSRTSLAKSAAYLQESLNGMKTIQLYAAEEEAHEKYNCLNKEYCDAQNLSNVYDSSLFSIVEGITSVATALVIWYGAIQIWDFGFTVGVLIVFITTLGQLFVPVRQFAQQISTIQQALSALEHIDDLFEQQTEEPVKPAGEKQSAPLALQEVTFRDVSFSYMPDSPDVLKNVSFTLRKGDRVALVGTTGSGKSTIIRLLTKAYTGYRGSITIDGSGPYTDPHPGNCGFGAIVATDPEAPTSVVAGSVPAGTEYCGPDVTDIFFDRMRVMVQRLAALPDSEKGLFDGTLFLARNGTNMDFEVGAVRDPQGNAVCPTQQCRGIGFTSTFTLCGQCMMTHIDNDIEFGVVAQLLGVPRSVQLAGAHAWDLWQRQALDPLPSQAAYLVGNVLGAVLSGMPQIPNSQLCALLGAVSLRTGVLTYSNAYAMMRGELAAFGKGACQPCPYGCPEVLIQKDFATQPWGLDNGGQAVYPPQ